MKIHRCPECAADITWHAGCDDCGWKPTPMITEVIVWADGEETRQRVEDIGQGSQDNPRDDILAVYYEY